MLKALFIQLLFLLLITPSQAQFCTSFFLKSNVDVINDKICPELLLSDLQFIKRKLDEVHPSLYAYCSKASFDSSYNASILMVNEPLSIYDFSLLVSDWVRLLKDSHTFLIPKYLASYKYKRRYFLPFRLVEIDNKILVEKSWKNRIPKGSELISFDQVNIKKTQESSFRLSPTDGDVASAREEFSIAQLNSLLNLMSRSPKKNIKYTLPGQDTVSVVLKAPLFNRSSNLLEITPKEKNLFLSIKGSNAHLVISSFSPKSYKKFKNKLTQIFKEIKDKQVESLVIDLRNNTGGFVGLEEYLRLLIANDQSSTKSNYVYKRSAHDRFSTLSFQQRLQFKKMGRHRNSSEAIRRELAFYQSPFGTSDTILITTQLKNKYIQPYTGKCTLLTNGLTMSASANFTGWFRSANRGLIIGTPCMGTSTGTFANSAQITLPNTLLSMSFSTLKITPASLNALSLDPIIPDVLIYPTQTQLLNNIDPCLEYLLIKQ